MKGSLDWLAPLFSSAYQIRFSLPKTRSALKLSTLRIVILGHTKNRRSYFVGTGGLACGLGRLGVSHHARGVIQDPRFRFATSTVRKIFSFVQIEIKKSTAKAVLDFWINIRLWR